MRRRVFWVALPIAVVFALCVGPGLANDEDELPPEPAVAPIEAVFPVETPECEETHDPGPDGDR